MSPRARHRFGYYYVGAILFVVALAQAVLAADRRPLQISGIYPHLAAFNTPEGVPPDRGHGECGIGAVVPWAGRLWYITYPPHQRRGSRDKLHEIDERLNLTIRPESVGGTHANRLIHRESNQLIIGPYFIDAQRNVRAADLKQLEGRMTATARHLTDPVNKVYFFDMEGTIYEVDVHSLAVTKLFDKPVPGWHGKGAYTAQGRLVVANNGELLSGERSYKTLLAGGPAQGDEAGVLAEWDGNEWRIVERKQFTDVTGPGGILGSPNDDSPLWSMGWDRRSVILKLLDDGRWSTFRLPKGSHTFDPRHGWFTEWPRIRAIGDDRLLMVMHGTMFDFPKTFSAANRKGIRPLATHLRYIPDFCDWNGRLVLAADDASFMQNPIVGQPQSNLWFGTAEELTTFGPRAGWGGVWVGDDVTPDEPSDPFLIRGYTQRVLHLAHNAGRPVRIRLELDREGNGQWTHYITLTAGGYTHFVLPEDLDAEWVRLTSDTACIATAYFHLWSPRHATPNESRLFDGLADLDDEAPYTAGTLRPAGHNRCLQFLARTLGGPEKATEPRYHEVVLNDDHTDLVFQTPDESRAEEVAQFEQTEAPFSVDAASVVITAGKHRYRLPKGPAGFDALLEARAPRGVREAVSERYLANLHGTFYEIPRGDGHRPDFQRIKPVCSHGKRIDDFCTWRGLLVLSGVKADARPDGHVFAAEDGPGLWFGHIDDLWKLGKPVGRGGPWHETAVEAGQPSDPYLMTGYDRKTIALSHDAKEDVAMTIEINPDHRDWRTYRTMTVSAGETATHRFPEGFHAHWVRVTADRSCRATAVLTYE